MEASPEVLGKLLLLQSTLHAMSGPGQLAEYIAAGLVSVPGISAAAVCREGSILGAIPADWGSIVQCSACTLFEARSHPDGGSQPCLASRTDGVHTIALRTSFNHYGFLLLRADEPAFYQLYLPFIESVANVMALSLEARVQADKLRAATATLEARVQQRTTELGLAQTKVHEQEHLIERIVSTAPTAIYIFDIDQQVSVFANERIESILGYSPAEIQGFGNRLFPELLHPEDLGTLEGHQARLFEIADGTVIEVEYRMRHAEGGYRWLHSWESVFSRDDNHRPVRIVGVALDVTRQREVEALHAALEKHAVTSRRMEAIGQLAGGVAHDFNNLLTVINSYAEFGIAETPDGDPTRNNFIEILRAGHRASNLTQQLLAFGRKQVLKPKPLNLNRIVVEMESLLRRLIGEHIEFRTELCEDLGLASVDVAQMEQVLMNLVINARDAMPNGGHLAISTRNVREGDEIAAVGTSTSPGNYVALCVSDSGVGMDEAIRQRIFEPFFTTKEPGQGTGLGLATVYGITKQSGGEIGVRSEPGKGSRFELYLPRVVSADNQSQVPVYRPRSQGVCGRETVLIVEDEDSIRSLAEQILAGAGYQVLTAGSSAEALRLCLSHRNTIHLLLMDVVLPSSNGGELAARLCGMRPRLKVLYMSGYTPEFVVARGVAEAGVNFIAKPFTPETLQHRVRELLDTDEAMSSAQA